MTLFPSIFVGRPNAYSPARSARVLSIADEGNNASNAFKRFGRGVRGLLPMWLAWRLLFSFFFQLVWFVFAWIMAYSIEWYRWCVMLANALSSTHARYVCVMRVHWNGKMCYYYLVWVFFDRQYKYNSELFKDRDVVSSRIECRIWVGTSGRNLISYSNIVTIGIWKLRLFGGIIIEFVGWDKGWRVATDWIFQFIQNISMTSTNSFVIRFRWFPYRIHNLCCCWERMSKAFSSLWGLLVVIRKAIFYNLQ